MMERRASMSHNEVILYTSHDGRISLKLKTIENTVWLAQVEIAELFGKGRSTIAEHISAIFSDGELESDRVCRKFRQTADEEDMTLLEELQATVKSAETLFGKT